MVYNYLECCDIFFTSQYLNIKVMISSAFNNRTTTELVFMGCVKLFLSNRDSRKQCEIHKNNCGSKQFNLGPFVSPCDEPLVRSNKSSRRRRRHGKHRVPPDTWGIEISDGLTLASSNAQGM